MKKPTKEELNEQLEETVKKAEEEVAKIKEEEQKKVEEIPDLEEIEEDVEEKEENDDEEKELVIEDDEKPVKEKKEPNYKEKFSNSARENQKIHAKNRKINEAVAKAAEIEDVDEEEILKEYPDWDVMSETERKIAKNSIINQKRFDLVAKATEEAKKIEKWSDDVLEYIENPKTLADKPQLEGKEEAFIQFANKTENHAVPFDILVNAFLYENNTPNSSKKGKMFETGKSEVKPDKNRGKITLEQAELLRKTDYKKYKEYLLADKIQSL